MEEFMTALELATDEELHQLADMLFRRKFNPVDYLTVPEVMAVLSLPRPELIEAIAQRFRFLAADGFTVLRRKTGDLSYREVLEKVCQHLKIRYSQQQSVAELESELFLNLLSRSWKQLPQAERDRLNGSLEKAISESELQQSLPSDAKKHLSLILKGSSAIAINSLLQPAVMHFLARQLAWQLATYQASREALKAGGTALATRIQAYFSAHLARHGLAGATARYAAARTAFAFLTPALWGIFFADLGWRAIATNYARIIPVIFTLAQIRLLRDL